MTQGANNGNDRSGVINDGGVLGPACSVRSIDPQTARALPAQAVKAT